MYDTRCKYLDTCISDATPHWIRRYLISLFLSLVLCEYSKLQIITSVFDSKRAQLFETFEYLSSPILYLFNRMMPIFSP